MILLRYYDFRYAFSPEPSQLDDDGFPYWEPEVLHSPGFDDGFTGIPRPITAFPITVSIDSEATTAVDTFHWYLSQRTDDSSLQWLSVTQSDPAKSGTVTIGLTAKCVTDMGLAGATSSLNEDQLREILKHCHLYVVEVSSSSIQWIDLLQYTLSDT